MRIGSRQCAAEEPNHRHRRLLRPRRERPSGYTAADKCDEFPPPHGAYPKAKDCRTKYSRCWSGSVARIAIKAAPLRGARWASGRGCGAKSYSVDCVSGLGSSLDHLVSAGDERRRIEPRQAIHGLSATGSNLPTQPNTKANHTL